MPGITAYDHVGIRVTSRRRSIAFYGLLGFRLDGPERPQSSAVYLIKHAGLRIHLICNGEPTSDGGNVLMDTPVKWPGVTHPAFVVDRLQDVLDWAAGHGVAITEGPVDWGRRRTCFLRDPDGTVLEFNELVPSAAEPAGA